MHETPMASEQNIMPLVNEIFNTVENGQVPNIPPLISPGFLRNADGENLLIMGARFGHTAVVNRFRNDIDVDEVDNDGWSALLCAAHQGHADCVRLLLEAHASVDQPDFMGMLSEYSTVITWPILSGFLLKKLEYSPPSLDIMESHDHIKNKLSFRF